MKFGRDGWRIIFGFVVCYGCLVDVCLFGILGG